MIRYTKKFKKAAIVSAAALMSCSLVLSQAIPAFGQYSAEEAESETNGITKLENGAGINLEDYFDASVVKSLPETVSMNEEISVIVKMDTQSLAEKFDKAGKSVSAKTLGEYAASAAGRKTSANIRQEASALRSRLTQAGVSYTQGETYDVLFGGFEITVRARDFSKICDAVGSDATVIVGEVYNSCESEVVNNDVNVYEETGIFDSSDSDYDGSGTTIAVLDTGLDYTHSAFDVSRFTSENQRITLDVLSGIVGNLSAATTTSGLTASDLYLNAKVPFAYDYADKDPDVYPLESEHGTHVSGVIVGNDDTITGVAPNAQLVSMKVFSDTQSGARTSWLLSALQDCVLLGVDVINMSLGSSCGFARESDKEEVSKIYDDIKERGISLVVAASNSYNSTFGSEKNGNLGLTSNPDSATVGSPSTYDAALSVASVSGTKTPYMMYNGTVIYFTEASDQASQPKEFVNEILGNESQKTFTYVRIPGVGRSADYTGLDVTGKIALVSRGTTSFEDKVRVAQTKGAAGVIIYNNVSGSISMTIGHATLPACSVTQDNGKLLAAQEEGQITLSKSQVAGPFMSDFSSWGPTSDLGIKPEITAHGGNILSAVPGQRYDRLSGTSMASPNQAGVTALIRQYVKETFEGLSDTQVTARVNQIMMSTTDIVYNTNGLPYAVRKQGSGLANLTKATTTPAYISTYKNGEEMDKAKIELGDDPKKTGVYTLEFAVNNFGENSLSYDVSAVVMTEGVSETLTARGDRTVTQEGYLLDPAVSVKSVKGGSYSGNSVTVAAGASAFVTVEIRLSDSDKKYLDESFANGMYVEGFVKLTATNGTSVSLNVPYLAFYGDWTQAPIFDVDYFATDPDEKDNGIDDDKKTKPDAYATTPVGGLYEDYISYLGGYYFVQNPSATQIAANRDHISLSNQEEAINSIYAVWAGLLRGAKRVEATITDSVTGEVIYRNTEWDQRKSYNYGSAIVYSSIDFDFNVADYNLKNNTRYDVKLQAYLDYGDGGVETNLNNTFEFFFTTDFQAPAVTGCDFYTEYDASAKKTRLYANIAISDNHYSMAATVGYVYKTTDGKYGMDSFEKYITPLYSSFNSTYTLTYELTDYIETIKKSYNNNSFVVQVFDYALNSATYEISIPDEVSSVWFNDASGTKIDSLTLSPNEVYTLNLGVDPALSWKESVNVKSSDESVVGYVNGKLVARGSGTATVTATSNSNSSVKSTLEVTVCKNGDAEYVRYDKPVAESFKLTGYETQKAYYFQSSSQRDIGEEGYTYKFAGTNYALSFYPSESVTIHYDDTGFYFPDDTQVVFSCDNTAVARVDENGTITALAEGTANVSVQVRMDGKNTLYSQFISITVKNPYATTGYMLTGYKGLGGRVEIPEDLGVTEISSYAFSNYEYIPKDENDEISEEDPYYSKISPYGEHTITEVVIPEGVEVIDSYAFSKLTALERVVLPSTLKKIQAGAFEGCKNLTDINLENVQFINQYAFHGCPLLEVDLSSIVAIGNGAFEESWILDIELPESAQSIGARAFYGNVYLGTVTIKATSVKLGAEAFAGCVDLREISVNASVIPASAFEGCTGLQKVTLGSDVSVIGAYAFKGTKVSSFGVSAANAVMKAGSNGSVLSKDGSTLLLVAPACSEFKPTEAITAIGDGAFSGNTNIKTVDLPNVTSVGSYAFAGCTALSGANLSLGALEEIGESAFEGCVNLREGITFTNVKSIGNYAFFGTDLAEAALPAGVFVGDYAFAACPSLATVTVGDNATIGEGAFTATGGKGYTEVSTETKYQEFYLNGYIVAVDTVVYNTKLTSLTIGDNVTIGDGAFLGASALKEVTLGDGAKIGDSAFYNASSLTGIDLSKAVSIGAFAFSGDARYAYYGKNNTLYGIIELYGSYAPRFENADLSSVTSLGDGAFAYNMNLKSVTLNKDVEEIGNAVFLNCASLDAFDFEGVTSVGAYAFAGTALTSADLRSVKTIGASAFRYCDALTAVQLREGVEIGAYAFYGAQLLSEIDLGNATVIGNYAFSGAESLKKADLTSAVSVGDHAFAYSGVTEVVFGNALASQLDGGLYRKALGENPFVGCAIDNFTDGEGNTTFTAGEEVFVENGVLYGTAPGGGYVLASYPLLKTDTVFAVKEGTVRLSAYAFFANSSLVSVELPYELGAVGHKAFYGCGSLTVVVFKSLNSPILEEEYDESYQLYTNLPQTGTILGTTYEGLGIVPYTMWNVDASYFYYGANFVNYVGHQNNTLIMVSPSNGAYYNTFVLSKYFTANVAGAVAPHLSTLEAIAAIDALPSRITLNDKAQVAAAREKYSFISQTEQQALVTNYSKLTSAENTIKFLEQQGENGNQGGDVVNPVDTEKNYLPAVIALGVLTGVFALTTAAAVAFIFFKGKKKTCATEQNIENEQAQENEHDEEK